MTSIKEIMDDTHTVAPDTLPGGHAGREEAMSKILQNTMRALAIYIL
jgi:hypothetical protein